MKAILKREIRSYFTSPVGYVCIAALTALYGYAYYGAVMYPGSTSNIPSVYNFVFTFCMVIIPIITMRSMSEDRKNKTDQALLTAPVSVGSIVMGKFLAAYLVFLVASAMGLLPAFAIFPFVSGTMPWGILFGNFIGTLLYGGAMIAIGVFISSLTESQVVAAVASVMTAIFLMYIDYIAYSVANDILSTVVGWISFLNRYNIFLQGLFNVPGVVFFISVMAIFVFLAAKRLESRRWS